MIVSDDKYYEILDKRKKKILVFANDAGSANIIHGLKEHEKNSYKWTIIVTKESPARNIFENSNLVLINKKMNIQKLVANIHPDIVIWGTGFDNHRIENLIISECKKFKIPVVAIIDSWCNYAERFNHIIPDYTAVCDKKAYALATKLKLPKIIKLKNYYLENLISNYEWLVGNELSQRTYNICDTEQLKGNLLIISSKLIRLCHIVDLLNHHKKIFDKYNIDNIVIRIHPKENINKYRALKKKYGHIKINIENPFNTELIHSLYGANLVVGCESMPLFICSLIGKPFYSYYPRRKHDECLPISQNRYIDSARNILCKKAIFKSNRKILLEDQHDLYSVFERIYKDTKQIYIGGLTSVLPMSWRV